MRIAASIAAALLTVAAGVAFAAGPGSLDQGFGENGWVIVHGTDGPDYANDVAVDRSGRVFVCGAIQPGGSQADFTIARLKPNGKPDKSFSDDGVASFDLEGINLDDDCTAVAVRKDGKVVALANVADSASTHMAIVRLRPNGELDGSFKGGGWSIIHFPSTATTPASYASGVTLEPNGQIVVTGQAVVGEGNHQGAVARLRPNGGFDNSFSKDGRATFSYQGSTQGGFADAAIQGHKIVLAGNASTPSGIRWVVFRLKANGSLDKSFAGDGSEAAGPGGLPVGVAATSHGRIVVGGSTQPGSYFGLAAVRLLPDGKPDKSFSGDGTTTVTIKAGSISGGELALQGGKVVLGGALSFGDEGYFVARLTKTGGLDKSFDGDGKVTLYYTPTTSNDELRALATGPGGRIVGAGTSYVPSAPGSQISVMALRG
jgi:uncharacterized delta-60 repeat protein